MPPTLPADRLGTVTVWQLALCAAAPMTVVAGLVPTGYATTGVLGIPAAFLLAGLVLLVWSIGYCAMSREIVNPGAMYAFLARGLGRPVGVAGAWVALVAYLALGVGLFGIFGVTVSELAGNALPWWCFALLAWALVAVLGLARIEVSGSILVVLMVAEVAVIGVFTVASLLHPASGQLTFTTLAPEQTLGPGAGALFVIAVTGYTGFETTAVWGEEARGQGRTVTRATYLTVVGSCLLYTVASWAMSVAAGPSRIAEMAAQHQGDLFFVTAQGILGTAWAQLGHALLATSVLAAMVSYHGSFARYLFSLGREGVLPAACASVVARTGAPRFGSLVQTWIGLGVIALWALAGWDPLVQLFFLAGTWGGFGVLLLLTATSAAVLGYFRHRRVWSLLPPALALVALAVMVVLALEHFGTLLGVAESSPLCWVLPAVFGVVAVGGMAWALWLRVRRPEVYRGIGR